MDFLSAIPLAEVSAVFAIVGALLFWSKQINKGLKGLWAHTLGKRSAQLDRIEQELMSNGGTSIKDVLRRIEHRLNEIDAFQRASLNVHDVAIMRFSPEGKVVNINREYQKLTGASLLESRGDGWINVIHPEVRESVIGKWYRAVKDKREFHEDIWFRKEDGTDFWAHANVYREMDAAGEVRGYLGVIVPFMEEMCPYKDKCAAHQELGLNKDENDQKPT